jgi:catechol 2,3-dioxygenase-like lactoylglutathione lyase family enzyme
MKPVLVLLATLVAFAGACSSTPSTTPTVPTAAAPAAPAAPSSFDVGAFSVSLAVKDLATSRAFYEKLGFVPVAGDGVVWQILRNGDCNLGLFEGLFDKNVLTFNPGWSHTAQALPTFTDVRELQRRLAAHGLQPTKSTGLDGVGPASFTLDDPDGNPILFDQHVPAPAR